MIVAKMERDGVKKEIFTLLLRLAKEGKLKQSAGAGIGVERLITWVAGARHVGEVQAFPKVTGVVYDLYARRPGTNPHSRRAPRPSSLLCGGDTVRHWLSGTLLSQRRVLLLFRFARPRIAS